MHRHKNTHEITKSRVTICDDLHIHTILHPYKHQKTFKTSNVCSANTHPYIHTDIMYNCFLTHLYMTISLLILNQKCS